jgi:hypothetical protein
MWGKRNKPNRDTTMTYPDQIVGYDLPLNTKLTFEELRELSSLARQDGWKLEDYATEVLRGHLYVTRYLVDGTQH